MGARSQHALVVEDEILISVELANTLQRLGFRRISQVDTVANAMDLLNEVDIDFAILDVILHGRECLPIARYLRGHETPFFYYSGFLPHHFPHLPKAPWVSKPGNDDDLRLAVDRAWHLRRKISEQGQS